mmetsp:Transcript_2759/g.4931  ORF Transcript_2759/g.4931 Transcript_2759/m.4931 type:complete len:155 (-) Transcript_2759:9-473(-)
MGATAVFSKKSLHDRSSTVPGSLHLSPPPLVPSSFILSPQPLVPSSFIQTASLPSTSCVFPRSPWEQLLSFQRRVFMIALRRCLAACISPLHLLCPPRSHRLDPSGPMAATAVCSKKCLHDCSSTVPGLPIDAKPVLEDSLDSPSSLRPHICLN